MKSISENIKALTLYGLEKGLLSEYDIIYTQNKLLEIMNEESLDDTDTSSYKPRILYDPEYQFSYILNMEKEATGMDLA